MKIFCPLSTQEINLDPKSSFSLQKISYLRYQKNDFKERFTFIFIFVLEVVEVGR